MVSHVPGLHYAHGHHAHGCSCRASKSGWWKQSHIQKFLPIKEACLPFSISGGAGGSRKARVRESVLGEVVTYNLYDTEREVERPDTAISNLSLPKVECETL